MGLPSQKIVDYSKISISFDANVVPGGSGTGGASVRIFNPAGYPGIAFVGGAIPVRDSIGGHVASKLALDSFLERLCTEPLKESPQRALEDAFKFANTSIYDFGHKLAASGRMATSFIGLGVFGGEISVGRIGQCSAYLYRDKELLPFFEESGRDAEWAMGNTSLVSVQLSTVPIQEFDTLVLLSQTMEVERVVRLIDALEDLNSENPLFSSLVRRELFPNENENSFVVTMNLGPELIFLR